MARSIFWKKLAEVMAEVMAEKIARNEAERDALRWAELMRPFVPKGGKLTLYVHGEPWIEMEDV